MSPAINDLCPWSNQPVQPGSLTQYRGEVVGFCNTGCRDKFETALSMFDAAIVAGPTLLQRAGVKTAPITLETVTLVIVDAQEDYRSGALPLDGMAAAVSQLERLLAAARNAGTPVIHVVHRGKPGGLFDLAGPGGAILAEIVPCNDEAVVEKTLPNSFAQTALAARFHAAGRSALLLAGFMTHNCVEATARAALDLGIPTAVVADATATRALPDPLGGLALSAAEIQRASLAALADRTAEITTVAAIIAI